MNLQNFQKTFLKLNPSQLTFPNIRVIYNQPYDHLTNFYSQISTSFNYEQHFFRLVNMPTKEKNHLDLNLLSYNA